MIPPHVGDVGRVSQESAPIFLMAKMEEPHAFMVGVRFDVEQIVDLM